MPRVSMSRSLKSRQVGLGTCFFIVAIVAVLCLLMRFTTTPLKQSEMRIREMLISLTPLGMTHDQVLVNVCDRGWLSSNQLEGRPPDVIRGDLGSYMSIDCFPFWTYVTVFWEFDEQGRLCEIRVQKDVDAI